MGAAAENNLQEQTLAERWRLIERIGQGAMGEVWRGKHALLGHEVAVKLMRADAAKDRNLVGRFKREARIAAQLRHRNLVRVEDFGVTGDDRPFLVMEFLKGRTLGKFLEETPKPTLPTVLKIVQQMGAALDAAHAEGIVHRDLKPDNVYLIADDEGGLLVKVLDFGIAKVTDGMFVTANGVVTAAHALLGTPMYMSPEQARGDADVDKRSDLWSVGVMAFEMLTGRMPFEAPTVSQVLLQVLNAQVPSAAGFEPQLPPSIDAWFARALGREKPQRFQSGRELSSTLATVLGLAHPTPSIVPAVAIGGDPSAYPVMPGSLGERVSGAPAPYVSLPPTSMTPMVSMAAITGRVSALPDASAAASIAPFNPHGSGQYAYSMPGAAPSPYGATVHSPSSAAIGPATSPARRTLSGRVSIGMSAALGAAACFAVGMAALALIRVSNHTARAGEQRSSVTARAATAVVVPSVHVMPSVPLIPVPVVPSVPAVPAIPSASPLVVPSAAPSSGSAAVLAPSTAPAPTAAAVEPSAQRTSAPSTGVAPRAVRPPRAGGGRSAEAAPPGASGEGFVGAGADPSAREGFRSNHGGTSAPRPSVGDYNPDMP